MREIKFRALDKENKEWIYSNPMPDMVFWKWVAYGSTTIFNEWTGLKDKNGVEIYEGDMVEYKAYNIWHRDEVKFTDGKFHGNLNGVKEELQSRYDLGLIVTLGCEVIGNIYENKELLAESEQE